MSKEELRQYAAISTMTALLETTKHSIIDSVIIKDMYAKVAVMYADALIDALDSSKDDLEKWFDNELKKLSKDD